MKPTLTLVAAAPPATPPTPGLPLAVPEQAEMPFAVVNGEPITQLPRDLYIPPQALEVFLEAFEGPLDLLLYLIRRQNIDVLDIPIAEITQQYTRYIELMQDLQLELAGEYLVMAATLAEIKSRMLLPRPPSAADGEDDPRAELVRRLQEYERFKRAAMDLDQLPRLDRDVWQASAELTERPAVRTLPQITLREMLLAFRDVATRAQMFAHHHVRREPLSVRERMSNILAALEQRGFVQFAQMFTPSEGRAGVTVCFVAILELIREGLIDVVQSEPYAPLHLRAASGGRRLHLVTDGDAALPAAADAAAAADETAPDAAAAATDALQADSGIDADDDNGEGSPP